MGDPGHSTVKLPMPEQIIAGRYRIISRLGSGGMGLVFLAEQLGVGNKVALKFLDPEPSTDETRATRFLREAKVALQVQHPGATQILDLGRDESMRLFMCFELVEGEDLREVIKREGRLRFGEARSICVQVAQVLAFAHERGIVHRDVKPENLRVRRDLGGTHVKVLDFGIARLLKDTGVRLTAEGMLAGTPRYMAPEQVKDEPIDGRIDQYALALVLFEMLTGAVAIGGKNITQILMHQMKTLVAPLAWVDPQLANPVIDAFIARASAKEPADRFPSMADFVTALQALQVDERGWPEPKAPPAVPGSSVAQTKEGAVQPAIPPGEGESDTLVPVQTQQERRLEVITEPDREPVSRRNAVPAKEPTTDPQRIPQAHPALELPTDPERPRVNATITSRRAPEPARQKLVRQIRSSFRVLPLPAQRGEGWGEGPELQRALSTAPHPACGRPLPASQGEVSAERTNLRIAVLVSAKIPPAPAKTSWLRWVLVGVALGLAGLAAAWWWSTHR